MGLGVLLTVIGAILTFAVRANTSVINITTVGIIVMVAGVGLIIHARRGTRHERIVTEVARDRSAKDVGAGFGDGVDERAA